MSDTIHSNQPFNNPLSAGRIERQMRISAGDRLIAVLGYLPLIPLLLLMLKVKRTSMFAQFNIRQGAVLFGMWAVLSALAVVFLFVSVLEVVGLWMLFLALIVYALMALIGIVKVLLGERYRMPVVADVALAMKL